MAKVEGVPRLVGAGDLPTRDICNATKALHYIVTSFFAGYGRLTGLRRDNGLNLPVAQALDVAKRVLNILDEVHKTGWGHGDLSPNNVLVGGDENRRVGIIDFGSAYRLGEEIPKACTPPYVPPEYRPAKFGIRTDTQALNGVAAETYSMGMLLIYLLLEGQLDFNCDSREAIARWILETQERIATIHDLRDSVRQEVCRLIGRATSFDPNSRYQSAKEMLAAMGSLEV